jgi:hypothetical protein
MRPGERSVAFKAEGEMQRSRVVSLAAAAIVTTAVTMAQPMAAMAATQTAASQTAVTTPVIVVLKAQSGGAQPLMSQLNQTHATHVKTFKLVNALSATVSQAEEANLAADPSVAEVVPDSRLRKAPKAPTDPAAKATAQGSVCPPAGKTQLEPEALSITHTDSDDPSAKTARSLGFTGKGVKVAYIADSVDPNNEDFIRADGSHVFTDYKDFTGEGAVVDGSGDEATLDASSIAAQGLKSHQIPGQPAGCNIRVEGVAPGASLVGLRVFPDSALATTSALVEAIDYAVTVEHVDVLNESFGYDPFPDTTSQDIVKLFNDYAVDHGVTVTASSGDAGTTGTIGSPSTDPKVIEAGASTTFRVYAQTVRSGYAAFGATGWTSDNISSLSSAGTTQNAHTVDLVAPGDLNWTAVDNPAANGLGVSGGTSESAPLTAGTAALVIEAYAKTHQGRRPSPALVKQIITSTTDDLGYPAYEQGTGRLDAYKAVLAAESVQGGKATGSTLLVDHSQLSATAAAGEKVGFNVKVTNTGARTQTVNLAGRAFGAAENVQNASVSISDTLGSHTPVYNYEKIPVRVPAGSDRLDASIAYKTASGAVRLILLDPHGKYTAYSLPQGVGNYGHVDVRYPVKGTWTAVVEALNTANGGAAATAKFQASTSRYHGSGSVSPSTLKLSPGQSRTVRYTTRTLNHAGDTSESLVLNAGAGGQTTVPVVLRSLVNGRFSGTLTGGNGRQTNLGQSNYYQFDVKAGQKDIDASLSLTNDPGDEAILFLIDPHGQTLGFGTNRVATGYNQSTGAATVTNVRQATVYHRAPEAGRWTLGINFAGPGVGNEVSQPFSGAIQFNKVDVSATGLPKGATLAAGKPVTVKVRVHNTGVEAANFFVDPRLNTNVALPLSPVQKASGVALPLASTAPVPSWLVPSETTGLKVSASASESVLFDFGPITGDPDILSTTGKNAEGWYSNSPVTAGVWSANPLIAGVFGSSPAPAGTVDLSATATTKAFDPAVTSSVSDLWQQSANVTNTNLSLFTVQPGQTRDIPVTITPAGTKGAVVKGTAFVDDLVVGDTPAWNAENFALPSDFATSLPYVANGSELASLPYEYKIG